MPCNDITDTLKILLSHDDRLLKYALRKKTCGGEVGRKALIGKWLKNRSADEIIATPIEEVLKAHPTRSDVREFMVVKHFLAVRTGLEIMLGRTSGGVKDYCKVARIEHGPDGMLLEADLSVQGMTDEIRACGNCANCGSSVSKTETGLVE
jgi:hypothetical protein